MLQKKLAPILLRAAAISLLVALTAACDSSPSPFECRDRFGCIQVSAGQPIKIGVLQALSGKVAPLGEDQVRGIEIAVDNHEGQLLGHPIALQTLDTGCTAEGGANAVLKLIADPQTTAILGTTCSVAAASASQAMSEAGMVMISGNNSAPFLTAINGEPAPDWHPGYFRTAPNEEHAGKTAALYAFKKLGVERVATINDGDIYTRGLTEGFEKVFTGLGGKIVLSTAVHKGDKEMRPVLEAVLNAKAELLFFPLFQPEGNLLLIEARKIAAFDAIHLMSDGALIESSFIKNVQSAATGMYFVGPANPESPAVGAVANAYRTKFGTPPATSYYLSAYDATGLLLAALKRVAVRSADGTLHIGRQALRNALYATRQYTGVTGVLTCDPFGDCAAPAFNVLRLEDPDKGVQGLLANVLFTYAPQKESK